MITSLPDDYITTWWCDCYPMMTLLHDDDIATWRWHCITEADAIGWWWSLTPWCYDNTRTSLHGYHVLLYCMCTWYYFLFHLRLIEGPRVTGEWGMRRWWHKNTGTYLMLVPLSYVWIFHVFHFWGEKTCQYASCYRQKWYHYIKKAHWWKMTFRQTHLSYVSFRWAHSYR